MCVYEATARVAKEKLLRETDELRRQNALSDQILHALRSDHQVPTILQLLKDQESLAVIAKVAISPSVEPSVISGSSVRNEGVLLQRLESEDCHSPAPATMPNSVGRRWIAASYDRRLIKHLFFLYWTQVHPAYLLFNMEQFIEGFEEGKEEHCSAFLVAAVCAAACHLLGPLWTSISGKAPDVAKLRRDFALEARFQEALADRGARTWLEASRVMLVVDSRMEVSCLTRATGFSQLEE